MAELQRLIQQGLARLAEKEFAKGVPPASALTRGAVTLNEALHGIDATEPPDDEPPEPALFCEIPDEQC